MKVQFLATGQAPDNYSFNGDVITAIKDGQSEDFDFSSLEEGGEVENIEVDTLDLPSSQVIRNAERVNGELHLTLCQKSGDSGYWQASEQIDVSEYDSDKQYINQVTKEQYHNG